MQWINQLSGGLRVLDVGGRLQPYRELLAARVNTYTAVDVRRTGLVDVIATGEHLPFASESFDLVICTQVLEYVPEPRAVLAEIHRVLRNGGTLMLSVPAAQIRDADEECWRFYPAGIQTLLSSFAEVVIAPEGGSILGFFRTLNVCSNIFAKYNQIRLLLRFTIFPLFNLLGFVLEAIAGSSNDQFTVNYSVLARKQTAE